MTDKNEIDKQGNDKLNAIVLVVAFIVFALLF